MNAPLWQDVKDAMEIYNFNGKHYEFVNSVSAEAVVIYNKQTIEENGFDDPWELYQAGEWNWDTFTSMLEQFVFTLTGSFIEPLHNNHAFLYRSKTVSILCRASSSSPLN